MIRGTTDMGLGQSELEPYKRVIVLRDTPEDAHHPDCEQQGDGLMWLCYKDCDVRARAEMRMWLIKREMGWSSYD